MIGSRLLRRWMLAWFPTFVLAHVAGAQERSLQWRTMAVEARLDAEGALHVSERQVIVFTGDWNGGYRSFDVRTGQRFNFHSIARVDSTSGTARLLIKGDLSRVDHFDWTTDRTIRWRSRLPSDPFFNGTALEYVLEYSYENILVPRNGRFVLDHDFAFRDRTGDIESFALTLTLDPVWRAAADFNGAFGAGPLAPGRGFVVTVPLEFTGAGRPAAVDFAAPMMARIALAALLLLAIARMSITRYRHERSLGRFAPLPDWQTIDEAWLKEHVLARAPEVVGAAWDDTTGASEVAAVLARLVSEGKLASEVRSEGRFVRKEVLSLKLLVHRSALNEYERSLIDALFVGGSDWTDTVQVREHYKKTGFDPSSRIRGPLERIVKSLYPGKNADRPTPWRSLLLFLAAAAAVLAVAIVRRPADAPVVAIGAGVWVALYITATIAANLWRNRVTSLAVTSLVFLVPLALYTVGVLALLATGGLPSGLLTLVGLTLLALAMWSSVTNVAGWKHSTERMEFRRRLAAARQFFATELRREQPRLRDDWFPYLIAFGLAKDMDRWFRAFGGTSVQTTRSGTSSFGGSGHSHSGGQTWTGFGGGGGFSGGGASASWAAAASSMAAGVASPSSSGSSGGGGGGGGSSGGGGGGGW